MAPRLACPNSPSKTATPATPATSFSHDRYASQQCPISRDTGSAKSTPAAEFRRGLVLAAILIKIPVMGIRRSTTIRMLTRGSSAVLKIRDGQTRNTQQTRRRATRVLERLLRRLSHLSRAPLTIPSDFGRVWIACQTETDTQAIQTIGRLGSHQPSNALDHDRGIPTGLPRLWLGPPE